MRIQGSNERQHEHGHSTAPEPSTGRPTKDGHTFLPDKEFEGGGNANQPCVLCSRISTAIQGSKSEQTSIAPFKDFKNNNQCSTCRSVADALIADAWKVLAIIGGPVDDDDEENSISLHFYLGKWELKVGIGTTVAVIDLIHLDRVTPVDEHFIDTSQIKEWIKDCDEGHAGSCDSLEDTWTRVNPAPELILIDVERQRLVQRKASSRYVALSYMWGQPAPGIEPFQTTLHSYKQLSQEGAFSRAENYSRLPNVIRDSITLTKRLGLRYLWCDRFCIIQDDPTTKPMFLNMMGAIYSTSHLTIAACEGNDGNIGLLGISADRPRRRSFYHFNFGPAYNMTNTEPLRPLGVDCKSYHTRGWTFQEWCLAPRLLAFHHNTVSFRCRRGLRTEIGVHPRMDVIPHIEDLTLFSRWPNFASYGRFVTDYTTRKLTYPEDVQNAFSAFITYMGRTMPGGILFGLPEMIFSGALCWQPLDFIERRRDRHGNVMRAFPSWSWLGWSGHVDTRWWKVMHDYFEEHGHRPSHAEPFSPILPYLTFWKTKGRGKRIEKEAIHNGYYEVARREDLDISHAVTPPGLRLRHPVPLADEPVLSYDTSWEPVILFRTSRVSNFRIRKCRGPGKSGFDILTATGEVAGIMVYKLLDPFDIDGDTCDLICIGRMEMEVDNKTWYPQSLEETKWFHKECPRFCQTLGVCRLGDVWTYKCYSVMWVEWEDGIAYRKAVGRVFEHVWDTVDREEIDVRLG